jgi:hypothetical protein
MLLPTAAMSGTENSRGVEEPTLLQLAQAQGQMPMRGGQAQGQQQTASQDQMTQQEITNFLNQAAQTLRQAAANRNPQQIAQFMKQNMSEDAVLTTASELYLGNNLIAQTFAQVPEEEMSDVLGLGAPALHGRRLLQDYTSNMNIQNIRLSPNQEHARVNLEINENGRLALGDMTAQVMSRIRQHLAQMGVGQQQGWGQQMPQGMQGQGMGGQGLQGGGFGQFAQGQSGGQMQGGSQGGPTWRQFGIGGSEGLRFQGQANCVMELSKENGVIKIGNTFCRAQNQLS